MTISRFMGFEQRRTQEEKMLKEATRKIYDAVLSVLRHDPAPTESRVREAIRELQYLDKVYRLATLEFHPRPDIDGKIRGPLTAQFWFTAFWSGFELKGGTVVEKARLAGIEI